MISASDDQCPSNQKILSIDQKQDKIQPSVNQLNLFPLTSILIKVINKINQKLPLLQNRIKIQEQIQLNNHQFVDLNQYKIMIINVSLNSSNILQLIEKHKQSLNLIENNKTIYQNKIQQRYKIKLEKKLQLLKNMINNTIIKLKIKNQEPYLDLGKQINKIKHSLFFSEIIVVIDFFIELQYTIQSNRFNFNLLHIAHVIYNKYIKHMLRHSKTTQNLMNSLEKLKEQKKQISEKLKQNIARNNQFYSQHSLSTNKYNLKVLTNRQRSIQLLQKKLNNKIKVEQANSIKLTTIQKQANMKRQQITKKIEQIHNRNNNRIQQLKNIQQKIIKKIQQNIQKNQIKQKNLRLQYLRIKNQQKKLSQVKIFQKKQSLEQWKLLQGQKWRLQSIIKQHQENQKILITQKNPIPLKKQEKKKAQQKYIPTQKTYNKLKSQKIDAKQMGKKYLEQAKLLHREQVNKQQKKKIMNVNLKIIGYNSDIMEKIYRNTSDLSNLNRMIKTQKVQPEEEPEKIQQEKQQIKQVKPEIKRFQFKMSDDLQTQRYLKQIKNNLSQLQKIETNQNPQNEKLKSSTNLLNNYS